MEYPKKSFIIIILVFIVLFCIAILGGIKTKECFEGNVTTNFTGMNRLQTQNGIIDISNGSVNANIINANFLGARNVSSNDVNTTNIKSSGSITTSRLDIDKLCMQGKCVDTTKLLDVIQTADTTPDNITISDPNGSIWKYDSRSDVIRLKTGDALYLNIFNDPQVYNNKVNRIALKNVNNGTFVRHAGYVMHCHPFAANNFDFAWFFMRNTDGTYKIYNDFAGGFYVGYDNNSDVVLIVPPNDPRIISWKTLPTITFPTKTKDSSVFGSFNTEYNMIKSSARPDACLDIAGASMANSADNILWSCHGGGNQKFRYDEKQRISVQHSGMCLSPINGQMNNNTHISQFQCHDGSTQKWFYDASNRVVSEADKNKCLALNGGSTNNGTKLIIADCSQDVNQKFF